MSLGYIRLARSIRGVGSETCKIGADESVSRAALLRVELAVAPCYRILSGKLVIEADGNRQRGLGILVGRLLHLSEARSNTGGGGQVVKVQNLL